jgi:ferric-dicitrate binding protein FerR (iron transport regulator)
MPSCPEHRARLRRETLHALVCDDACKQLAADVAELLHAWLALHPEDAREADEIRTAVGLVGRACRSAAAPAEIVPGETAPAAMEPRTPARTRPRRGRVATVGAVLAASIVAVVAMKWRPRPAAEPEPAALPPIQWTRYELATDDSGRFTVRPASPGAAP